MSLNKSTSTGISQRTNVHAARQMLEHAGPVTVLEKFGKSLEMPANKGVAVTFRRPIPFTAATAPMVEGVTPTSSVFQMEDVPATMKQYGMLVSITDVIQDTHEDPVLKEATLQCGENLGRTIEALTYGVVKAGTAVLYANGASRSAVNTPISLAKQRAITRALKAQKAKKVRRMLSPSKNYGTTGIEAAYVAIAHTDCENDIRNMAGFTPVVDYGQMKPCCPEELGTVEDCRYILSPDLDSWAAAGSATLNDMVSSDATNADVYPIMYFGMDAYGLVAIRGKSAIAPTVIPVNKQDKSDPLGQRGYVGWKTWFAALILNQAWMIRAEVGVTDLS